MNRTQKRVSFFQNIALLITQLSNENIHMMPFSFHRTLEEQRRLKNAGKSRTLNSKHLIWLAMDLVLVKNGSLIWSETEEYKRAGEIWKSLGGTWGGDFRTLNDIYHFEWKD